MSDTEKPEPAPAAQEPIQKPIARPEPMEEAFQQAGSAPEPVPKPERDEPRSSAPRLRDLDKDIESELAAALEGLSDKELYGEPQRGPRRPPAGAEQARKKGKIVSVHGPDVFVDVPGGRSQGVLPMTQFPEGAPAIGSEVEINIEGYDHANGLLILTRKGAAVQADWSSVAVGMTVEARVTAVNKGGLSVEINGIRGFMPISQIDMYRVENTEQYVNQRLLCLVTEVDQQERNLVVSRRDLLERQREEQKAKLWQDLAEGQVREGIVRSVRDFGAFVDLGGADGLLHVKEMSWSRVQNPGDIVQPGQAVRVVVLKVDKEHRKISLGLRQLMASPWDTIHDRFAMGSVVKGTVTRLMEFGAFVELEPGIEGLVHISELAPQRVHRVASVVQPGQEVQVKVLNIDTAQRRIGLSIKGATTPAPEAEAQEEAEEVPSRPPRPRTTPLRGGLGSE